MSNILKFIRHIDNDCHNNDFTLELLNVRFIDIGDGSPSSGYFSEDEKKICVSLKTKDFVGILAHEYSHFMQYTDSMDLYTYYGKSYTKIMEWLDGKRIQKVDFHLDNCLALELDCEKRAVELMKLWDLGIDIKDYIKRANAYMYFWKYLKHSRKWCNPYNTPSCNDSLVNMMPNRFLNDYTLTDELREIFEKESI